MEEQITQSSTFPHLPSMAVQQQNGNVAVMVERKSSKRTIVSLKCLILLFLTFLILASTNILTYFFTLHFCETNSFPNRKNISVNKGQEFQIVFENEGNITQCSIIQPSNITIPYKLEKASIHNLSTLENGRIDINISQRWCKLAVKHALPKDNGQWELLVEAIDDNLDRKYQLYNVSVTEDILFVPRKEMNKTSQEMITNITSTIQTFTDFAPNTSFSNRYVNINTSLTRSFMKTTTYQMCPENWITFYNNCYKVIRQSIFMERNQASNICRKQKSNLASIHSSEEQTFISNYVKNQAPQKKVWVGGKRNENYWTWDDSSPFNYTNWFKNEPDSEVDCMYLHYNKNYAWHDANCGIEGKRWAISTFLCQKMII